MHYVFVLLLVHVVLGNEFYISTTGTDNTGCGDIYTPCGSLNFTLTQANNSDTIYFQEGIYVNQSISTILLDDISIIGQGNVTFAGIAESDAMAYDAFITILGSGVNLENLQFSDFYSVDSITYYTLIFIGLSEENENESGKNIFYNFTDISIWRCGSQSLITTSKNKTIDYFGKIFLNNFNMDESFASYILWSVLEANVNGLTVTNSGSDVNPFLNIFVAQQTIPVDITLNDILVVNTYQVKDILYYQGPFHTTTNINATDTVTINRMTIQNNLQYAGSLVSHNGANLVVSSVNVETMIRGIYAPTGMFYLHSPLLFSLSDSTFNDVHSDYVVFMPYAQNGTVFLNVDSLSVSNSSLTLASFPPNMQQFMQTTLSISNVQFKNNSAHDDPICEIEANCVFQNVNFDNCTAPSMFQTAYCTVSNVTVSNSVCTSTHCLAIDSPVGPVTDLSMNNVVANPSRAGSDSQFVLYIAGLSSPSTPAVYLSNTSITNVSGFEAGILVANNLVVDGNFTYENVTSNNVASPIFATISASLSIDIVSSLPAPLSSLSDIYDTSYVSPCVPCEIAYLGFTFEVCPTRPYFSDSKFSLVWLVTPACVALIMLTVVISFVFYRRKTTSYSSIN